MEKNTKNNLQKVGNGVKNGFNKLGIACKNVKRSLEKIKIGKFNGVHVFMLLVVILVLTMIFSGDNYINYPVVYNNGDGDLYLMPTNVKSEDKAIKLSSDESLSDVLYANTTDRYVLFKKGDALYLYDAKDKDETTKIASDVKEYQFSDSDKYIVYLNNDDELMVYDYKENHKLDSDVSNVVKDIVNDKILYVKENVLYIRSVNYKKKDRNKITEDFDVFVRFSEDGKKVVYISGDGEGKLFTYDVKKDRKDKIANDVTTYYCDDKSCDELFYVTQEDTRNLYYYDGKESKSVSKDLYSVASVDVKNKRVLYTKNVKGELILYFQTVGKDAYEVENKMNSLKPAKLFDDGIYYFTDDRDLNYVAIKGSKLGHTKNIGKDVIVSLYEYKDGFVFLENVENAKGDLYIAKNGKSRKIDEKVSSGLVSISNDGSKIYYLRNYKDNKGDLCVSKGGKGKLILEDVYEYQYVKDDLIYAIKDYIASKARGDLYRYTGKATLLGTGITRIASIPSQYEK